MSPSQEGEHALLRQLCDRLAPRRAADPREVPIGDDAAILLHEADTLVATTDAMVEGVHFRLDWLSPGELGYRAAVSNLSDLAAMGATPSALLLALALPDSWSEDRIEELVLGVHSSAEEVDARLVGGNLSRAAQASITITALGSQDGPVLRRSGARPGDLVVVTGTLGDAAAAVAAWESGQDPLPPLRERFARPKARLEAARVLAQAGAHAAIDVSDGLLQDLGHLCAAAGIGAEVERAALPRSAAVERLDDTGRNFAASGGEDYELLVALPPELDGELAKLAGHCGTGLSVIGRFRAEGGVILRGPDGNDVTPRHRGHDHHNPAGVP